MVTKSISMYSIYDTRTSHTLVKIMCSTDKKPAKMDARRETVSGIDAAILIKPAINGGTYRENTMPVITQNSFAQPVQWDAFRGIITDLYQQYTLAEVVTIMKDRHSFIAT